MFFARDKNLFDLLLPHYGDDALHQVQDAFTLMDLPMPEQMEYRDTTDVGAMVFLNPYGCTVRVTNRKKLLCETALRHPRLLQPLGTFPDTILKIDVYPGIIPLPSTAPGPDRDFFNDFQKCGLEAFDGKTVNCGTIGNGYIVMFDIPGVQKADDDIKDEMIVVPEDVIQAQIYSHLRVAFAKAVKKQDFQPFWELCSEEHTRGLLKSNWMTTKPDSMVDIPAAAYERRLVQHTGLNRSIVATHYSGYNLGALL